MEYMEYTLRPTSYHTRASVKKKPRLKPRNTVSIRIEPNGKNGNDSETHGDSSVSKSKSSTLFFSFVAKKRCCYFACARK